MIFGVILVLAGASLAALAGHVLLLFDAPAVIMTGACIYGITMPLSTVLLPLFCRLFWKGDYCLILFEDTQVFPDFDKGLDAGVELLFFVCGRELHTNAGLSLRYDGIIETGHIDAFVEHLSRKGLR